MGPADIIDLPPVAKEELAQLFKRCEEAWTWPRGLCINRCHLSRKPSGGLRSLASAPYLIRLWGFIRAGPTDEWIEARAQFWDKAVKKSSALQTSLIRCLREEAASALGATVVNGLVDITGFYDHIDLGKLLTYAVEWGFLSATSTCPKPHHGLGTKGTGAGWLDVNRALCTKEVGTDGGAPRQPQCETATLLDTGGNALQQSGSPHGAVGG